MSWHAYGLMGAAAEIASNTDCTSSMPKELCSLPQKCATVDKEKLKTTRWVGLMRLQVYLTS